MTILLISVQMGKLFLFHVRGSEYQETYTDFSVSQRSINSDVMQIQIFFLLLLKQKITVTRRNQNPENGFRMRSRM